MVYNISMKQTLLKRKLKKFVKRIRQIDENYSNEIAKLEAEMAVDTGIEDIELFRCDNEIVGIGNYSRDMTLIHLEELENGK